LEDTVVVAIDISYSIGKTDAIDTAQESQAGSMSRRTLATILLAIASMLLAGVLDCTMAAVFFEAPFHKAHKPPL
jgi:hypothetical protein